MSGTGDPDYESRREVDVAPRRLSELIEWLNLPASPRGPFYEDTWADTCRTRFFLSFSALLRLAEQGSWPADRWRDALQAWSDAAQIKRSWRFVAHLIARMPDETFAEIARAASWWLEAASKSAEFGAPTFIALCRRVLGLPWDDDENSSDTVFRAINHPVGLVTQGLLNLWFGRNPNDNDGLPEDLAPIFTDISRLEIEKFKLGRVVLASRVIALFRVDRPWTEINLLPIFSWSSDEATGAWQGFLWSPRLHWPLLLALKEDFLSTSAHYAQLGDIARQHAALLTYASLEPGEGFAPEDFKNAIAMLPQEGLEEVARTLGQALEGAADRRQLYWENRVKPFWRNVWPKSRELASNKISESLARLAVAANESFPEAFSMLSDWLSPIEHPHYVIHLLNDAGLAAQFPKEVLEFLNLIIDDQPWPDRELRAVLDSILSASPAKRENRHFIRLDNYLRQRNL